MKKNNARDMLFAMLMSGPMLSLPALAGSTLPEVQAEQLQDCACFTVQVVGEGPALILIPGLASSGEVWQTTVEAFKDNYQLHILTLAGFAGNKPLPAEQWSKGYLALQQQAIMRYIKQQQLVKPVIIGHSLGGYLALALASSTSDVIGGAINIDGLPALGVMFAQQNPDTANTATDKPQQNQQATMANFDPMMMAKGMSNNTDWHQRIVDDMARSDGMTSGRVMGELMQADLRPQLAEIKVPVLTIGALQNGAPYATPTQVKSNYETQLAKAPSEFHRFAFAPDSKHFIMADAPQWLNQQIQEFLQENSFKKIK